MKMPEELLLKLAALGNRTDEIIPKVLEVGGKVVLSAAKSNLQSAIGSNTKYESRSTGQLLSALGLSGARRDKDENYNVKIGFDENRTDGKSNAMIANVIEYGKHGQPPKPFLKPAVGKSKNAVISAMTGKYESEVRSL
jgi:HK97 gp10 family phage protein